MNDPRFIRKGREEDKGMSLQAKLLMSVPSYSTLNQNSTKRNMLGGSMSVPREQAQLPYLSNTQAPSLKSPAKFTKRSNLNDSMQEHSLRHDIAVPSHAPEISLNKKGKVSYSVTNRKQANPF